MQHPSVFPRLAKAGTLCVLVLQLVVCSPEGARGNPSGGQVVAGQAVIRQQGTTLAISQTTPRAVINWREFSIPAGDVTRFIQPSATSATLNRVAGFGPSRLDGSLTANGQVFLINPNGVIIGADGRIETSGFCASTLDIPDTAFMTSGNLEFGGDSTAGIRNLGVIQTTAGDILLMAHTVENDGVLKATDGAVGLAGGREVLYCPAGAERLFVKSGLTKPEATYGVANSGIIEAAQAELRAAGGNIYALAVNNGGAIHVTGVREQDGRVLLVGDGASITNTGSITAGKANGDGGEIRIQAEGEGPADVTLSGALEATGTVPGGNGGKITVTGETITLSGGTSINAGGDTGGGFIRIGGDYKGENPEIYNAATISVESGAEIHADAFTRGDGGRVIVWSEETTRFLGRIQARGGLESGNGGFVEVSGHSLDFEGLADLASPKGEFGTLLLDPAFIYLSDFRSESSTGTTDYWKPGTISGMLNSSPPAHYILEATESIFFEDGVISWSNASELELRALSGGVFLTPAPDTTTMPTISGTNGGLFLQGRRMEIDPSSSISVKYMQVYCFFDTPGFFFPGTVTLTDYLRIIGRPGGYSGAASRFMMDNANNTIPRVIFGDGLGTTLEPRTMAGDTTIVNGNGNLSIETADAGQASWFQGNLTVRSKGDLLLTNYLRFDPVNTTEVCILSTEGRFINNGAPLSLYRGAGIPDLVSQLPYVHRMLVFSTDPRNDSLGASDWWWNPTLYGDPEMTDERIYAKTYANLANIPAGNWFIYSLAPVVTLTPSTGSRPYGDGTSVSPWAASGVISGDSLSGAPTLSIPVTEQSDVGAYSITLTDIGTISGPSGYTFQIDNDPAGTLEITRANLAIYAQDVTRLYGEENPAPFPADYYGLMDWDKDPFTGDPKPGVLDGVRLYASTSYGGPENVTERTGVGNYPITWSGNWGGITSQNYNVTTVWPATLTISPAPLTITANNITRRIGDPNPAYSVTYTGLMAWDDPADPSVLTDPGFNSPPAVDDPPGAYPIDPTGAWAANYDITYIPGIFTIKDPYPLTITAADWTRLYGEVNPAFTALYVGFQDGDTSDVVTGLSFDTLADERSPVGPYAITPSGATLPPYYTVTYVSGQLRINPALLTIAADNVSRRIGDPNPAFAATYTGLTAWDRDASGNPTATAVIGLSFETSALPDSPSGQYYIRPDSALAPNYTITYVDGTLTIREPYQLIITADNAVRIYGSANPAFTVRYSGFEDGDDADVVSGVRITTTATHQSPVGTYFITLAGGSMPPYYTPVYVPGRLQINPAPLIITADNASRRIGDPNPAFTATYIGLMAWDRDGSGNPKETAVSGLSLQTPADAGSVSGQYPIRTGSASAANYEIAFMDGILTILAPYHLLITVNNITRMYGDPNPVFTWSCSGFQDGDTANVVSGVRIITTADDRSPVGQYVITPSGGIFPAYYTPVYVDGRLQVTSRPLNLYATDTSAMYGSMPDLSYTSDILPGDSLRSEPRLTAEGRNVGIYAIRLTGGAASNYTVIRHDGVLAITPAPLDVRANDAQMIPGQDYPAFTAVVSGLLYNDTADVLQGLNLIPDPAGPIAAENGYSTQNIVQSGPLTALNYAPIAFTPGVLNILPEGTIIIDNIELINSNTILIQTGGSSQSGNRPWPMFNPPFGVGVEGSEALRYIARNVIRSLGLYVPDINAWLMDPGNRALMAPALFEFLMSPLNPGTILYDQREIIKTALQNQIREMQVKIAEDAVARYHQWKQENAKNYTRMEGLFGNLDVPPEDFVDSATTAYIGGALSLAALGSFAAAFAAGSSMSLALPAAIAPYAASIAGSVSSAALGASGIAAGAVLAIAGSVMRGLQLDAYLKTEEKYNNLVKNARNFDINSLINGDTNAQNQLFAFLLVLAG